MHTLEVTLVAENGELKAELELDGEPVEEARVRFENNYNGKTSKKDKPKDPGKVVIVPNTPRLRPQPRGILPFDWI